MHQIFSTLLPSAFLIFLGFPTDPVYYVKCHVSLLCPYMYNFPVLLYVSYALLSVIKMTLEQKTFL